MVICVSQGFSKEVEKEKSDFETTLSSCGLLETPFDQSQFESEVSALKDKMNQCDKVSQCLSSRLGSLFFPSSSRKRQIRDQN